MIHQKQKLGKKPLKWGVAQQFWEYHWRNYNKTWVWWPNPKMQWMLMDTYKIYNFLGGSLVEMSPPKMLRLEQVSGCHPDLKRRGRKSWYPLVIKHGNGQQKTTSNSTGSQIALLSPQDLQSTCHDVSDPGIAWRNAMSTCRSTERQDGSQTPTKIS